MKLFHKALSLLLCMIFLFSLAQLSNAATEVNISENAVVEKITLETEDDAIQYFSTLFSDDGFGGIYYEGNILVVNYVPSSINSNIVLHPAAVRSEANIVYRAVSHSFQEIDCVKDFLAAHMEEYDILVLDANEMTNQVDISLSVYNDDIISEIQALVDDHFGKTNFLNFIDRSNCSIVSTVAYELPKYPARTTAEASPASTTFYSIFPIMINNGYYTLGPATSTSTAYTAGHGYTGSQLVYKINATGAALSVLGSVQGHYGGSYKDWGRISVTSGDSVGPVVSFITSVMGKTVYMWGAVSQKTQGVITGTDLTVPANAPYADLTGMCSASYSCAQGDSGAGVFSGSDWSVTTAYGIQSSALFYTDASGNLIWAGTSYYTPM